MNHFAGLTPGEHERLALLMEELAEAIQAIGKIMRHGYSSFDPTKDVRDTDNRTDLEKELGDVMFSIELLSAAGDVDESTIDTFTTMKAQNVWQWLHHQSTAEKMYQKRFPSRMKEEKT